MFARARQVGVGFTFFLYTRKAHLRQVNHVTSALTGSCTIWFQPSPHLALASRKWLMRWTVEMSNRFVEGSLYWERKNGARLPELSLCVLSSKAAKRKSVDILEISCWGWLLWRRWRFSCFFDVQFKLDRGSLNWQGADLQLELFEIMKEYCKNVAHRCFT